MQELAWNMNQGGLLTLTRLSVNHSTTVSRVETETTSTHTRTASPCVSGEVCMETRILILVIFFWRITLPMFVCFAASVPCRPLACDLQCPFGFKQGEDGCPVCQCEDPCEVNL